MVKTSDFVIKKMDVEEEVKEEKRVYMKETCPLCRISASP